MTGRHPSRQPGNATIKVMLWKLYNHLSVPCESTHTGGAQGAMPQGSLPCGNRSRVLFIETGVCSERRMEQSRQNTSNVYLLEITNSLAILNYFSV